MAHILEVTKTEHGHVVVLDERLVGTMVDTDYCEVTESCEIEHHDLMKAIVPFDISFAVGFMSGFMQGEQPEAVRNWEKIRKFFEE